MKINNLTKGIIAFSVLSMLASGALVASAASETGAASTTNLNMRNHSRGFDKGARVKSEEMTDAQKTAMDAKKAEMDKKSEAVKAAIVASDYNAWVAAEKAINENSLLLSKITADNFSKYVEAYNLRVKADTIMKDLGVTEMGMGLGLGYGLGMNHGMGLGQNQK